MGIKRHTEKSLSIVCTDPEISYRKKTFPDIQSVTELKHKICCTACGRNLMKEIQTGLLCIHPSLEVIICKECLQFYGDGLFKTDKKGDDVYCRWCAQGGTIYCCSKCSVAFCKKCIDRNLKNDKKVMADVNKDNWSCFVCASKPLWYLRAFCWAVQKYKKDLTEDSRKRKLSASSAESAEKFSKPGPASAKKSFAGPASKKAKLENTPDSAQKKPGPASKTISKRPGPASRTKPKVNLEFDEEYKPIQTRHKKIDYSPKIEFSAEIPKKRKTPAKKTPVTATNKRNSVSQRSRKRKIIPDISSSEEFDNFSEDANDNVTLDDEVIGPVESVLEQVFDFCFKLSNNFNTKLMKYKLYYKSNVNTSDKVNNACVNLHMDLKKIVRLYNAIDEKMMFQLDEFNAAQQALENEKLDLTEPVTGDIDIETYGIDPKTPPEPEVKVDENDEVESGEQENEGSEDIADKAVNEEEESVGKSEQGTGEKEDHKIVEDVELSNTLSDVSESELKNSCVDESTDETKSELKNTCVDESKDETNELEDEKTEVEEASGDIKEVEEKEQEDETNMEVDSAETKQELNEDTKDETGESKKEEVGEETKSEKESGETNMEEDSGETRKREDEETEEEKETGKSKEQEDETKMQEESVQSIVHEEEETKTGETISSDGISSEIDAKDRESKAIENENHTDIVVEVPSKKSEEEDDEFKRTQNGSSNLAQENEKNEDIDALSDISDNTDVFMSSFDKIGTKPVVPESVTNYSNGDTSASVTTE